MAGVLTERYLRKVVAQNKDANATAVGSIMTDKKLYDVAQTTRRCSRRLTHDRGRHRHMPVVNANRTMAGMLCIGDVTRMVVDALRGAQFGITRRCVLLTPRELFEVNGKCNKGT